MSDEINVNHLHDELVDVDAIRDYLIWLCGHPGCGSQSSAWDAFCEPCDKLIRYLVGQVNSSDPENLVGEVWLQLIETLNKEHQFTSRPGWGWIRVAIGNILINELKYDSRHWWVYVIDSEAMDNIQDNREFLASLDDQDYLDRLLVQLSHRVNNRVFEVVQLRLKKRWCLGEITKQLNLGPGQAKELFRQGYQKLIEISREGRSDERQP